MRDERERLVDILEAIGRIEKYASVEHDLPDLKLNVMAILQEMGEKSE